MLALDFIRDNYTFERASIMMQALIAAEESNVHDVLANIEEVIYRDDVDDGAKAYAINGIIVETLKAILRAHNIIIEGYVTDIHILLNIVNALRMVVEDYDPKYILDRIDFELDDANSSIDIIASIVELLTSTNIETTLDVINRVDDGLVTNIAKLLNDRVVNEPDIIKAETEQIEAYKKFLNGKRTGVVFSLLKSGANIGQFDLSTLYLTIEESLVGLYHGELIFELVSLVLFADHEEKTLEELFINISQIVGETDAGAKLILIEMKKLYLKETGISVGSI